jgi:branched-chain amino acid transport system permease protein
MTGWLVFSANVLTLAGIYAILATILNLEAGWGGLWDLGTAGLLAAGAYLFVILTVKDPEILFAPSLPTWVGIIAAALFTGALTFLIGIVSLRMRGEYFLITTFAFSVVVLEFINTESHITLGATGFHDIRRPFDDLVSTRNYNFVLLAIVVAVAGIVWSLVRALGQSPFGRLLRALRDNEAATQSVGKNVTRARLQAFVIAGAMIGAVSPLYVWYVRSLSPHLFHATLTFTVWTALVVGGIGGNSGPVLGALLLICLTEATQFLQVSVEYAGILSSIRPIIIGLALIVIMRFRPQGIIPERSSFSGARGRVDGGR